MGGVAQLGEHLLCKQGVIGSIPIGSTIPACRWCVVEWLERHLDKQTSPDDEDTRSGFRAGKMRELSSVRFFDIVNGFLIDAVTHRVDRRPE